MKPRFALLTLTLLPMLLPAAPPVDAAEPTVRRGDIVKVFRGDVVVPAGERRRGAITCIGGDVTIDGEVDGDVVVILGEAVVRGAVDGSVTAVAGPIELDGATVSREVHSIAGALVLRDAQVSGDLVNVLGRYERDERRFVDGEIVNVGGFGGWSPDLWALLFWVRLTFKIGIFLLLMLTVALATDRVSLIADEAPLQYVPAFLVGILSYVGFWVLSGLLIISFFGAVLLPLIWILFVVLKWLGIAGIFYAAGRRTTRALLGREMSQLAAVLLIFFVWCVVALAPSALGLGGLLFAGALRLAFFLAVEAPGVGLVILTLAGSKPSTVQAIGDDSPEGAR